MVKREIKSFELKVADKSFTCIPPCTVRSVLSDLSETVESLGSEIRFETVITADETALAIKYFYLRIRGIKRPAEVFIGDKKICDCDGVTPVYNLDLAGMLSIGENVLSVRFSEADGDLMYAGLSESFEIIRFGSAIINGVDLEQRHEDGQVTVGIKLDLIGDTSCVRAVATMVSPGGQIYYAGLTGGVGSVIIRDPLYWWPKGLGVQNIYRLSVNLYGDMDIEDSFETRIGLRTVETVDGSTLTINGSEMIPMGAVYVNDEDPDLASADKRVTDQLSAAAMAGYNCLVLPVSPTSPPNRFYDLCDAYGIAVIEEHAVIDDAVVDSLRARIHHPSLCLVDLMTSENIRAYEKRMKDSLGELNFVSHSSQSKYIATPAFPSMKSICEVVPEGERNLFSRSIEAISEGSAIKDMLLSVADKYPYPHDLSGFAYASALASAHKVGKVVKDSRLTVGKSGRGIFNRLCDASFGISSSAIDYRGRWKPIQYYCSRYFAPVAIYAELIDGKVVFYASNLRRFDLIGSLEFRIADASNYTVFKSSKPVEIGAISQGEIHTEDISEIIAGHENEYYLEYYVKEGSIALSKSVLLFLPEKHFDFKKPRIMVDVKGENKKFSITMSADKFVKDLEVCFEGVDGIFSDNYIDITSEAPIKIDFTVNGKDQTAFDLQKQLKLFSVWDLK